MADADRGAVVVAGKIAERDRLVAKTAAEKSVGAAGWALDAKPFSAKEVAAISECLHDVEAWPCVSRAVSARGLRRLAVVSLMQQPGPNGTPQVAITERLVLADADLAVLGQRFCERCTDDTLSALTAELTHELLQRVVLESGRTVLSVKSTPQGSIYAVDGVLSGATDATLNIVPGHHVVTIEREGYEPVSRTIDAVEGKTSEVIVTLQRIDPALPTGTRPKETAPTSRRSRALPITMVAIGAVAVIGGVTALMLDQREESKPPTEHQPSGYYDTTPAGIAAVAGGVVVAGAGAYLWWKISREQPRATPTVTPVLGGAVVGMHGAF